MTCYLAHSHKEGIRVLVLLGDYLTCIVNLLVHTETLSTLLICNLGKRVYETSRYESICSKFTMRLVLKLTSGFQYVVDYWCILCSEMYGVVEELTEGDHKTHTRNLTNIFDNTCNLAHCGVALERCGEGVLKSTLYSLFFEHLILLRRHNLHSLVGGIKLVPRHIVHLAKSLVHFKDKLLRLRKGVLCLHKGQSLSRINVTVSQPTNHCLTQHLLDRLFHVDTTSLYLAERFESARTPLDSRVERSSSHVRIKQQLNTTNVRHSQSLGKVEVCLTCIGSTPCHVPSAS